MKVAVAWSAGVSEVPGALSPPQPLSLLCRAPSIHARTMWHAPLKYAKKKHMAAASISNLRPSSVTTQVNSEQSLALVPVASSTKGDHLA